MITPGCYRDTNVTQEPTASRYDSHETTFVRDSKPKVRFGCMCIFVGVYDRNHAGPEAPPVEIPAPETPVERAAWEPSIQKVFSQLNTLDLFAAATSLAA